MVKRVSAREAKAHFASLVEWVAHRGGHVIIERHGKPVAALVSATEAEKLVEERPQADQPRGALALVGLWRDVGDDAIDAFIQDVYAERARDVGRPVDLEE